MFVTNEDFFHQIWSIRKSPIQYYEKLISTSQVKGHGHETGMKFCLGHILVTNEDFFTKFGL